MNWDAFWTTVAEFLTGPWGIPLQVLLIIVISVIIRVVLQFVHPAHRQPRRQRASRSKQNVDDTQALLASPVHAARVVQRTRALGGVLNSVVTTVVVITADHPHHLGGRTRGDRPRSR